MSDYRIDAKLCPVCKEPQLASHKCHVFAQEWFPTSKWKDVEDKEDRNLIWLCQLHHGVYFDNHSGRRDRPTHMLIDLDRNSLFIINPLLKSPTYDDIEEYPYVEKFDLKPEYVREKNRKCIDTLRNGWFSRFGDFF